MLSLTLRPSLSKERFTHLVFPLLFRPVVPWIRVNWALLMEGFCERTERGSRCSAVVLLPVRSADICHFFDRLDPLDELEAAGWLMRKLKYCLAAQRACQITLEIKKRRRLLLSRWLHLTPCSSDLTPNTVLKRASCLTRMKRPQGRSRHAMLASFNTAVRIVCRRRSWMHLFLMVLQYYSQQVWFLTGSAGMLHG